MDMNTTITNPNTYYVATEDGEHMDVFDNNLSIFEALCSYHKAINEGDEGYILEIELGTWDMDDEDCEMEPILFHEFWELLLLTSKELHRCKGLIPSSHCFSLRDFSESVDYLPKRHDTQVSKNTSPTK